METIIGSSTDDIKTNHVYEFCSRCGDEVMLENEVKIQRCPTCGHYIVPCSICPYDSCTTKCEVQLKFYFDSQKKSYVLMKVNFDGKVYTWKEMPTKESFFVGLWSISGKQLDCLMIKANF